MALYKKFIDGVPEYLARHYWWAYLWRGGIWFFDHQKVIDSILFGHYERLLRQTLALVDTRPGARVLQLTCVYGKLTPSLLSATANDVHLCDISTRQLNLARRKTLHQAGRCFLARMNAESLAYREDSFDQVIIFFLLHEMPPDARGRAYDEVARVVRPGGSVLITEYAATPRHHWLYRFTPFRVLLGRLEPFLPGFWEEGMAARLNGALRRHGKAERSAPHIESCFAGLYRITRLQLQFDARREANF